MSLALDLDLNFISTIYLTKEDRVYFEAEIVRNRSSLLNSRTVYTQTYPTKAMHHKNHNDLLNKCSSLVHVISDKGTRDQVIQAQNYLRVCCIYITAFDNKTKGVSLNGKMDSDFLEVCLEGEDLYKNGYKTEYMKILLKDMSYIIHLKHSYQDLKKLAFTCQILG